MLFGASEGVEKFFGGSAIFIIHGYTFPDQPFWQISYIISRADDCIAVVLGVEDEILLSRSARQMEQALGVMCERFSHAFTGHLP